MSKDVWWSEGTALCILYILWRVVKRQLHEQTLWTCGEDLRYSMFRNYGLR